jgi:hypothetical protein
MAAQLYVRKFVQFEEQVHAESGLPVSPPLTRVVVGAVAPNPLAGKPAPTDLTPLVELSEALGVQLTTRALDRIGDPAGIRAYGKAALPAPRLYMPANSPPTAVSPARAAPPRRTR